MADMKNKKTFSKKKVAGLLSLVVLLAAVGGTLAYYSNHLSLENPLKTPHSGAAIIEEFNPNSSFLPGETAAKKVAFQNTGEMDVYLRVKATPSEAWYDADGNKTTLPTTENDEDIVTKAWTDYWKLGTDDCEWSKVIGDYRYYNAILPAGAITNDILASITLRPVVSNDRHEADYSNKVYKLTFDAEAIPVEADGKQHGINTLWQMKYTDENNDGVPEWNEITGKASN